MSNKRHSDDPTIISGIWRVVYAAFTFLVAVVLVVAWLPVSLLFRIYRNIAHSLVKKKMGNVLMASGGDAMWLQESSENLCIINTGLMFNGSPYDINVFRKHMFDCMVDAKDPDNPAQLYFPKMQMHTTQIYHRYVWVKDKNFDISEHIYVHEKSMPNSKEELQNLVGELGSQDLPKGKSPWEVILIPYQHNNSDRFFLMFRIHHSIGDGVSLVKAFGTCLSDKPVEEPKLNRFGTKGIWMKAIQTMLEGPGLMLARLLQRSDQNVLHGPSLSGEKKVAWSERIELDLIKKIKSTTGTTVNDVLMSCLAGALRKYMLENSTNMPQNISANIPVDMRQSKKIQMDNQFSVIFLDLPLDEEDPMELLMSTKKRMDQVKASPESLLNNLFCRYSMARLPNRVSRFMIDWFSRKSTIVLSNVPGPPQKFSIKGLDVEDVIFWPPQRVNIAIGVSILSYNDGVHIGVMSDRAVLTKPAILTDYFVEKVNELATKLEVK